MFYYGRAKSSARSFKVNHFDYSLPKSNTFLIGFIFGKISFSKFIQKVMQWGVNKCCQHLRKFLFLPNYLTSPENNYNVAT